MSDFPQRLQETSNPPSLSVHRSLQVIKLKWGSIIQEGDDGADMLMMTRVDDCNGVLLMMETCVVYQQSTTKVEFVHNLSTSRIQTQFVKWLYLKMA